ncbi:Semaphorin-3C isoform 2 [Schistosoma japonicum]|uniref:Semaphorin-3C isoform 2 n=1 Tax=Schistosoma japonicum TaxID=6182 RepID=A0A4Z2CTP2_SCHJA|nr:Semaphorin-3C isoform 2 [Schistosoma japonicum]
MKLLLSNYPNFIFSTTKYLLILEVLLISVFIHCDLSLHEEDNHKNSGVVNKKYIIQQKLEENVNVVNDVHQSLEKHKNNVENVSNEIVDKFVTLLKTTTEINNADTLATTNIAHYSDNHNKSPNTEITSNKSSLYKYSSYQNTINNKTVPNSKYSSSSSSTFSMTKASMKSTTKIVENWSLNDYRVEFIEDLVQNNIGIKFVDDNVNDFSQMIIVPKTSSIYIVKNRGTLLKLDMTTLEQRDKYTLPTSTKSIAECSDSWSCHSVKEISLLAKMPDERMIWLCYVTLHSYESRPSFLAESGCMVPTVENLAVPLIQWENPHFNSLYPDKPASVLNAADGFTYISAFTLEYLRIFRAYMPDWNGNFNWTGALVTDRNPAFIAEPAQILLTFETTNEVYFVLREYPNSYTSKCKINVEKSINRLSKFKKLENLQQPYCLTSIARLVRVCKGDPGGLPHISSNRFATFAKADLICPATHENGGYFSYTHISAAYWDNNTQMMYATFTTEKSAPVGSALCIYSLNELEASFNGPLVRTNTVQNDLKSSPVPNSFSNICSRLNSKNRTEEEVTFGRLLSLRFPYRYLPVKPLHGHALISQTGDNWLYLEAYNLPPLTNHYQNDEHVKTSIIWIGTKKHLIQFALYTHNEVALSAGEVYSTNNQNEKTPVICKLREIYLGRQIQTLILQLPTENLNLNVNKASEINGDFSRNQNLAFKQLKGVNTHLARLSNKTNHHQEETINRIDDEEIRRIESSASNLHIMTNKQLFRLPLTRCSEYQTFDECLNSRDPHCGWNWSEGYDQNWLPWSGWSDCDLITNTQIRKRQCQSNAICSGSNIEQRSCLDDERWFKQSDIIQKSASYNKPKISYSTQTDGFTLTHLILVILCGLLTGSLITVILFWSCKRRRWSYDEDDVAKLTRRHRIKSINTHCESHLPYKYQQTYLTTNEPLSNHSWSLVDEKEPIWCNKSDIISQTLTDTNYECLPSSHILAANNKLNRLVKPKSSIARRSNTVCYDLAKNVHLISNTPLPSPTSLISNPSTTSTLLKDKFTFDLYSEQNLNLINDYKPNLINITPDNRNENNNENLGNLYLAGYLYTPIEPIHNKTITSVITPVSIAKIDAKLPENYDYQIGSTPTISSHYIPTNPSLVIPKSILIQPAYSSFRKIEHKNNNTMITTKCINGETFTITENPTHYP